MKPVDVILPSLIPIFILLHLLIAPYTKVEESFNIQATHDIATYGLPLQNISQALRENYDHFTFPGAVPRTFVGALVLAYVSKPLLALTGNQYAQFVVRAVLGLFNAFALLKYKDGLARAFGKDVGRWYILLQVTQFHVIYYASRTLPNMFAFGLTTLALGNFLPGNLSQSVKEQRKKKTLGIVLLVAAGVIFRSEIAVLLFSQLIYQLLSAEISLETVITAGISGALITIPVSVGIDSYFWQKLIWPELAGFYYNAIQGKSSDWGTSPFTYYLSTLLPRLLLNPLILFLLIPIAFQLPSTKFRARDLVIPNILFVAIYSLQPHKESRFIIYVVPPLTAAAALSASYIWTRRSKSLLYQAGTLLLMASVAGSFVASTGMLLISSLNYPGGDALSQLHDVIQYHKFGDSTNSPQNISIHMDVLSCMTGVTRFLQLPYTPSDLPIINNHPVHIHYDKTEKEDTLLTPEFWTQFDYALIEEPAKAIGKWEVVRTIFAYTGIEFLRPGDGSSLAENLERVYAANNLTSTSATGEEKAPDSEEVKERVEEGKVDVSDEERERERRRLEDLKAKVMLEEVGRFGTFGLIREAVRGVTGGWWVGPRMEARIRVLRRVKE